MGLMPLLFNLPIIYDYWIHLFWGNLHREIENDRNQRSEELLRLGGC